MPEQLTRGTDAPGRKLAQEFARERWHGRAEEALNVLRGWQAFGDLHSAWRDPWPDAPPQAYRAERALRFLRAGTRAPSTRARARTHTH